MSTPTAPAGAPSERRRWPRSPCRLTAQWYALAAGRSSREPAQVRDLSAGGLGLLCDCAVSPGELLVVELPYTARRLPRVFPLLVAHATPAQRQWAVGGRFSVPLLDAELQGLREAEQAPP